MPIYIKFDGVEGDSNSQHFHGFFDVFAFSWGINQTSTAGHGGGGGAGKVSMQDLHFVKQTGKASPKLFLACCQGRHFPRVVLTTTRNTSDEEQAYLMYEMENVMISSYQISGDGGSLPTESLSINFTKITYTQFNQRPDGSIEPEKVFWDFANNTGG